jgi:hypothetical protein
MPHGVTSQRTPFFIAAAVETSNLTQKTVVFIGGETPKNPYPRHSNDSHTDMLRGSGPGATDVGYL